MARMDRDFVAEYLSLSRQIQKLTSPDDQGVRRIVQSQLDWLGHRRSVKQFLARIPTGFTRNDGKLDI